MKYILKFNFPLGTIIMSTLMFGCTDYSTRDSAEVRYSDYKVFDHFEGSYENCKNVVYQDFELHFEMESPLTDSDLELLVIRNGLIYKGSFREEIRIENLPFCLDDGGWLQTLSFVILDHSKKQAYMWTRKNSYRLHERKSYVIRLMNSGNYRVKGMWFLNS
ncbi:hypothetical protein OAI64_02925 [Schleiferiaceae bacterium]|jgi:hypothetical protein|nr:hypothetical protein [Schleiferiaceae bacterium]MDC3411664.1 hypothetical protein [bacterium]PTM13085.1 MAG: hypothetical protein DA445_08595 [Bacteroidota bacterium]MDA8686906.1 hypothetical protein [Schleiferiaceae bacterium]MDA9791634.1 hypothetical protein [Schleiferiaceae bacterium]